MWRCPHCGRFLSNQRCQYERPEGAYIGYWASLGDCATHGTVSPPAGWEELWGEWDPEEAA